MKEVSSSWELETVGEVLKDRLDLAAQVGEGRYKAKVWPEARKEESTRSSLIGN